jgi:hypothetical protein
VLWFSNIRPITTLYIPPVIFIQLNGWSSIWLPGLRKTEQLDVRFRLTGWLSILLSSQMWYLVQQKLCSSCWLSVWFSYFLTLEVEAVRFPQNIRSFSTVLQETHLKRQYLHLQAWREAPYGPAATEMDSKLFMGNSLRVRRVWESSNSSNLQNWLCKVYSEHVPYTSTTILLTTKCPSPVHACIHSLHCPLQVTTKEWMNYLCISVLTHTHI